MLKFPKISARVIPHSRFSSKLAFKKFHRVAWDPRSRGKIKSGSKGHWRRRELPRKLMRYFLMRRVRIYSRPAAAVAAVVCGCVGERERTRKRERVEK